MDRTEAEDYVYESYLRAEGNLRYGDRDSVKRDPELTRGLIESLSGTPCVCVTGSKGKGSVCAMMSRILRTGMDVGLMTSPHVLEFNERFRVNGGSISDADLVSCAERAREMTDPVQRRLGDSEYISPMGIQAMIALMHFSGRTDFDIFECGKGARYDDVNSIPHDYSVINTVFLEHTRELGSTLEEIASDKACIIRRGQRCAYTGRQAPEVSSVLEERAASQDVPLKALGRDFDSDRLRYTEDGIVFDLTVGDDVFRDVRLPSLAGYQADNCALAMAVCSDVMPDLDPDRVRKSLSGLRWPGRMEVVRNDPLTVLDACINRGSCRYVREAAEALGLSDVTLMVAVPDDKDYAGVVSSLEDLAGRIVLCRSHNPHYRFSDVQGRTLSGMGIETEYMDSVSEAYASAVSSGAPVIMLGTTSFVSEAERMFCGMRSEP